MNSRGKSLILIFLTIITIISFFCIFKPSSIQSAPATAPKGLGLITVTPPMHSSDSIGGSINKIFNIIITVSEIAFILMFLIAGVMYLSSMGNEEGAGKAKKLMIDAVIGIVIVLSAWAIGTWVLSNLTT